MAEEVEAAVAGDYVSAEQDVASNPELNGPGMWAGRETELAEMILHDPRLRAAAWSQSGGSYADSQDLLQQTAIKAWEHAGSIREKPAQWARTVMRRAAIDGWRRQQSRPMLTDEIEHIAPLDAPHNTDPDVRVLVDQLLRTARLSKDQRAVVIAVCMLGMTHKEFAAKAGIAEGTSKTRLYYALGSLRASAANLGI